LIFGKCQIFRPNHYPESGNFQYRRDGRNQEKKTIVTPVHREHAIVLDPA